MNIQLDSFVNESPKVPGIYLWNSGTNKNPEIHSIRIVEFPEKTEHGIKWDSYLGVPTMGGRNVTQLRGSFLKLEFL